MKAYASGYKTVFDEVACRFCTPYLGSIPTDLKGTYFRAGPAMFSAGSIVPPKTSIIQPKQPPVPDGVDPTRMVRHPFEGDGAVLGITFGGGNGDADVDKNDVTTDATNQQEQQQSQAVFRYRFVRTTALFNERKKGEKCYTAMESTREMGSDCALGLGNDWHLPLYRHHLQPGLNKNRKNTSNTRAIYWGKRLLTLWEGGQPYKLDSLALSTEGRSRLGGAIRREEDPFGSKIVIDAKKNRALFYGLDQGAKQSEVTLYEFGADFRLIGGGGRREFALPGFAVLNDFCATENYAVFVQPSMGTNAMQFVFNKEPGKVTTLEKDKAALLHLIPRAGSLNSKLSFPIPVTNDAVDANLQFVNAYEDANDVVIVDAIRTECVGAGKQLPTWPWVDTIEKYGSACGVRSLCRYKVDTKSGSVSKECLSRSNCAFGVVNPTVTTQRHRFIYLNIGAGDTNKASPPQGIGKYDADTGAMDIWMPLPHEFCGEPMFAPKTTTTSESSEDDGYILSILLDGGERQTSDLIIFDAKQISAGPVARIALGMMIPHGLYGCFSQDAVWSGDSISRRARLADKVESRGNMWNEVKSDFSGLGLRLDDIDEVFPGLFG
ncbi:hypothetical protein ACA910_002847 [Epithemia clementina (nom. ined.)]